MFDSVGRNRAIKAAGLFGIMIAAWLGWTRVDWYEFFPRVPPDHPGEVVDDPDAQLLELTLDSEDVMNADATATAGEFFEIRGRLKLNPRHWRIPMPMGESLSLSPRERQHLYDRQAKAGLVECRIFAEIVCKSWLAPGERQVRFGGGTVSRAGKAEIGWRARFYLPHPGIYLVRIVVGEQKPRFKMNVPTAPVVNQRILKTFLLSIAPPQSKADE